MDRYTENIKLEGRIKDRFLRCCSKMSERYKRSASSVAKSSNNSFTYSLQDTLLMHACVFFPAERGQAPLWPTKLLIRRERQGAVTGWVLQSGKGKGKRVRKDSCEGIKSWEVTSCSVQRDGWWLDSCTSRPLQWAVIISPVGNHSDPFGMET